MKILVTGATGNLGKQVINFLSEKIDTQNIVAFARDLSRAENLVAKGIEVREGDYDDYSSLLNAFKDIDQLYFVSGNDIFKRTKQQENVVNAAKEVKVKHVVYTSFQRKNETGSSPIAQVAEAHLKTENWLRESGLTYTILKQNLYLDFLPIFMGNDVIKTGTIYLPAGEGKTAFALREDMAKVGAVILTTKGHENKEYDITGEKAYSYGEIADILTRITGRDIKYVSPSREEFVKTLTDAGVPLEQAEINAGFSEGVKYGEFDLTSSTIKDLLGQDPVTVPDYLRKIYGS